MQPFIDNNSILSDDMRTKNQGVEKASFGKSG